MHPSRCRSLPHSFRVFTFLLHSPLHSFSRACPLLMILKAHAAENLLHSEKHEKKRKLACDLNHPETHVHFLFLRGRGGVATSHMWPLVTSCLDYCGSKPSVSPQSNPLLFPQAWVWSCHSSIPLVNLQRHPVVCWIKFVPTDEASRQADLRFPSFQWLRMGKVTDITQQETRSKQEVIVSVLLVTMYLFNLAYIY